MSELIIWMDQEMNKLRRDMERLFDRSWSGFGANLLAEEITVEPSIDISETDDAIIVKVEAHGAGPEDLDILLTKDTLTIKWEKSKSAVEDDAYYQRVEKRFDSFSKTIKLPCSVKVYETRAIYKNGVLNILMPKLKHEKAYGIKIEFK
ncbi:MAG: Hsp20/alpha crystallin family protein [Desulfobacterales bacterium]|nr:Hsp20/alpha crystallin family protein [Desulfobacterales bacterium]